MSHVTRCGQTPGQLQTQPETNQGAWCGQSSSAPPICPESLTVLGAPSPHTRLPPSQLQGARHAPKQTQCAPHRRATISATPQCFFSSPLYKANRQLQMIGRFPARCTAFRNQLLEITDPSPETSSGHRTLVWVDMCVCAPKGTFLSYIV